MRLFSLASLAVLTLTLTLAGCKSIGGSSIPTDMGGIVKQASKLSGGMQNYIEKMDLSDVMQSGMVTQVEEYVAQAKNLQSAMTNLPAVAMDAAKGMANFGGFESALSGIAGFDVAALGAAKTSGRSDMLTTLMQQAAQLGENAKYMVAK